MKLPFHHSKITGRFGTLSEFRKARGMQPHSGLDFAMPIGTPIPALANGTIVLNQESKVLGHVVVLRIMDAQKKLAYIGYSHLQKPGLEVGTKVKEGETIGLVGNSGGASSGPHLHLTVSREVKGIFGPTAVKECPIEFVKANRKVAK
jgi:murein DD-endopeptidase MepM/ murein hydrolase activator NlpD